MGTLLGAFVSGVFITAIAPLCFGSQTLYALSAVVAIIYGLRFQRRLIVALSAVLLGNQLVAIPLQQERDHFVALQECAAFARPQMVRVQVVDLPNNGFRPSRFHGRVVATRCDALLDRRLRFSWYTDVRLHVGQYLLVVIDLKKLDYPVNFAGVDRELLLRTQGQSARGRVRSLVSTQPGPLRLSESRSWTPRALVSRIGAAVQNRRLLLREKLVQSSMSQRGAVLALLTGDASLLEAQQKALLQATGTSHLLVISGLHVGIVAALIMSSMAIVQRLLAICGLPSLPLVFTLGGVVVLSGYVAFVGASPSALRALCMSVVALLWFRHGRLIAPGWGYLAAFVLVVMLQPLASLSTGFWLSFALVGWLIIVSSSSVQGATHWLDRVRVLVVMQVGLSLIMAPFLSWVGLPLAPGAVVANLIAVPVVSLFVVPCLLVVMVCELLFGQAAMPIGMAGWVIDNLYAVANAILTGLMFALGSVARWLPPIGLSELSLAVVALVSLVSAIALLPASSSVIRLGAALALLSFYVQMLGSEARPEQVAWGEMRVDVLDVGQGTAVLVRTQRHALLYDTGARFPSGYSFAQTVILPALRRLGVKELDVLLVSHPDNDHAGGAADVTAGLRVKQSLDDTSCARFGSWTWSGVSFRVAQAELAHASTNDRSCVLIVTTARARVVLTGDVEGRAERALLASLPREVDLLVVPHHGSQTSSHRAFVNHLAARFAVATASTNNAFGHPHNVVRRRYRTAGSHFVSTGHSGGLRWRSEQPIEMQSAMMQRTNRWRLGAGLRLACDCSAGRSWHASPPPG